MEKQILKSKPKYIINDWGRINNYKSNKEVVRLQSVEGGYQLLQQNILNGFNPKYYIVTHFNDGGDNKRLQLRRVNPYYIEKDLLEVKKKLMQLLYGRGWDEMKRRCRCFFTIEYGNSTLKPHFNLLLERPPKVYDNVKSLDKLFNKVLPNKALCLWKNSSKVQQVELFNNDIVTLNKYINKENNIYNKTIPINVNDYVKSSKKNCKTKNHSYLI